MDHARRIAIITTIPATACYFMTESITLLKARGHTVYLLCGDDTWISPRQLWERFDVPVHVVKLKRSIAPLHDLRALIALARKLRKFNLDIVHYSTPKAALLGALAAWSAGVPRRVYTNRGLLAADVLVLPSYREGFPNVALEAAAMALPVITTDALGCVDAVRHGETGIVVPARDADALAAAMLALGTDRQLRKRMGALGRVWVLKKFVPEVIAEAFVRLLETRG